MQYINLLATCKYKQKQQQQAHTRTNWFGLTGWLAGWLRAKGREWKRCFGISTGSISSLIVRATGCFNACMRCFIADARRWNVPTNMQNNRQIRISRLFERAMHQIKHNVHVQHKHRKLKSNKTPKRIDPHTNTNHTHQIKVLEMEMMMMTVTTTTTTMVNGDECIIIGNYLWCTCATIYPSCASILDRIWTLGIVFYLLPTY